MSDGGKLRERLARPETQHEHIVGRLEHQDAHRAKMDRKLDHVVSVLDQAKGGWKTPAAVVGAAGIIGGRSPWRSNLGKDDQ